MSEEKEYRTYQIRIKKGHRMYSYFEKMSLNTNNLYNTTNFYIRQVYTALTQEKPLQPLQKEVLQTIDKYLDQMNQTQLAAFKKKEAKEKLKPKEERKQIKANLFSKPSKKEPSASYNFLDCLFKTMKQQDYISLPGQVNQQIMRNCFQNWNSFFKSLKDYKKHPEKYTGRPRIPGYLTKGGEKEVTFSNQVCKIQKEKYLRFPLTKQLLNIGKLHKVEGSLQQVRIVPSYGEFVVEVIFKLGEKKELTPLKNRCLSIDLGISRIATVVSNTGMTPVLFKGGKVKSVNQYYNKLRAHYMAALRNGKQPNEGSFYSKRLKRLDKKRYLQLKDLFHKISFQIVQMAKNEQIDTIVIGKNDGWKQKVNMGAKNNQEFVSIPYSMLIEMIQYKAAQYGIAVITTEESYTSKASFLDNDPIPTFQAGNKQKYSFSGTRKKGTYRTKNGKFLHSDINGSCNILRKVVPAAFNVMGVAAVCSQPCVVNVR